MYATVTVTAGQVVISTNMKVCLRWLTNAMESFQSIVGGPTFPPFPCYTARESRGGRSKLPSGSWRSPAAKRLKVKICAFFASQSEFFNLCFVTKSSF